jgi:DNA-directed RNA polymerase subunit M/transcription elongation factor TFIIS
MSKSFEPLLPKNQITITSPSACPICGSSVQTSPYDIHLTEINAKDEGWVAKGQGSASPKRLYLPNEEYVDVICHRCETHYRALQHTIPILCAPFHCPNCGKDEMFHFVIHHIAEREDMFEFEVELICKQCAKKRTLKKMISGLLSVIKLEVSPTGISVKNA